jgi:hypothetical protein
MLLFNFKNTDILTISLSIMYLIGCQAPRNNPLDPANPDNRFQSISGTVQTVSLPNQPIADVQVIWRQTAKGTVTDASGRYNIQLHNAGSDWLVFDKQDYFADSVYIEWRDASQLQIHAYLNAKPYLNGHKVYSSIENRYPNLQTERMIIQASITDPDNDIDSVFLNIPILEQDYLLPYNTTSKYYERTFSLTDLDVSSLDQLTGNDLRLTVLDIFSRRISLDLSSLKRVIRDEVVFISPSGNQITGPQPRLRWEPFTPGYFHTYSLEVFTSEIVPQQIWHTEGIADSISEFTVDINLPPDEYFWVIWAVDDFGNRTRSKPASFTVE